MKNTRDALLRFGGQRFLNQEWVRFGMYILMESSWNHSEIIPPKIQSPKSLKKFIA